METGLDTENDLLLINSSSSIDHSVHNYRFLSLFVPLFCIQRTDAAGCVQFQDILTTLTSHHDLHHARATRKAVVDGGVSKEAGAERGDLAVRRGGGVGCAVGVADLSAVVSLQMVWTALAILLDWMILDWFLEQVVTEVLV
ncbi:hypothetical protein AKJ16_DCAP21968 [Drosera capensis]